jgi:ABC-type transport system involved in cytochrome c biogenesis permease subunit
MSTSILQPSKPSLLTPKRALALAAALLALLAALLILSPAEAQLGNLIKVIYLHGALARVGLYALMLAALPALAYLIRPQPALLRWSNAIQVAGMVVFVVHFALSVIPTHATWGVWIAFDEPRTRMTLQIVGVGLLIILVRRLIDDDRLHAIANFALGAAVLLLNLRTGVLRHPLNPIGDSTSSAIQLYYAGILLTCAALTALLAWWLSQRTMNDER